MVPASTRRQGHQGLRLVLALLFLAAFSQAAAAAPVLGVNYYGESLMGTNGQRYIPRSPVETAYDLDQINQISEHIKIYMNPFVDENLAWNEQLLGLARERDMHTVVNMMVDDRILGEANWPAYASRVTSACAALDTQTDEILVGNEIILRSSFNAQQIKDRVVTLIHDCEQVFSGEVSYEEFWWVHDVWQGYPGTIYLMQYEDIPIFEQNTIIMEQKFGANARVGEWGEDLRDGETERDENWQRDQVALRYEILSRTSTPIAYIFTYKEPSWNAFGIVRPDGGERPVYTYLKSLGYGVNGTVSPPPPPPPAPTTTTVAVTNTFMADYNAVFVCQATGFTPTSYAWDFGDGLYLAGRTVNDVHHAFTANATTTVTCTATDGDVTASGEITINVRGRGAGPALVQRAEPIAGAAYALHCDAIGYMPGYCQSITGTNGLDYDWGCTQGTPDEGDRQITLPDNGTYTLHCAMHLHDASQLPAYYAPGSTYHVAVCGAEAGCVLAEQDLVFTVGNVNVDTPDPGQNQTQNETNETALPVEPVPPVACVTNWTCAAHAACGPDNRSACLSAIDSNGCYALTNSSEDIYSGNLSVFATDCEPQAAPVTRLRSSGGGGGGGGGYVPPSALSAEPVEHLLSSYGYARFTIADDSLAHTVRIKAFDDAGVTLTFSSTPVDVTLTRNESKNVDVTGDDVADVTVTLIGYSRNSATITLASAPPPQALVRIPALPIPEPIAQPLSALLPETQLPPLAASDELLQGNNTNSFTGAVAAEPTRSRSWAWGLFSLLALAGSAVLFTLSRREPDEERDELGMTESASEATAERPIDEAQEEETDSLASKSRRKDEVEMS